MCACFCANHTNANANVLVEAVLHINAACVCRCVFHSVFLCVRLNNCNAIMQMQQTSTCGWMPFVFTWICTSTQNLRTLRKTADTLTVTPAGLPCAPVAAAILSPHTADWIPTTVPLLQQPSRTVSWDTEKEDWCQLLIYSSRLYKYLCIRHYICRWLFLACNVPESNLYYYGFTYIIKKCCFTYQQWLFPAVA